MKCKEKGCKGEVDNRPITISLGCAGQYDYFPCNRCGRLYDKDGDVVDYVDGERAFLVKGEMVGRR